MCKKILTFLYFRNIRRLEKKIGYRVKFESIPDVWINGWMTFDMSRIWKRNGLDAIGVNYFTVGNIQEGVSLRFIRDAKQYQSWLGCYLVKVNGGESFSLQNHFDLANTDQRNWLRVYGDPNPECFLKNEDFREVGDLRIGGYVGKLYAGGGESHSDVGKNNNRFAGHVLMWGIATLINATNKNSSLVGKNFLPQKIGEKSYEAVRLKGYIGIFDLEDRVKLVVYGNGTEENFSVLEDDILVAFQSICIERIK